MVELSASVEVPEVLELFVSAELLEVSELSVSADVVEVGDLPDLQVTSSVGAEVQVR